MTTVYLGQEGTEVIEVSLEWDTEGVNSEPLPLSLHMHESVPGATSQTCVSWGRRCILVTSASAPAHLSPGPHTHFLLMVSPQGSMGLASHSQAIC